MRSFRWLLGSAIALLCVAAFGSAAIQIEFTKLAKPPKDSALAKAACVTCHKQMGKTDLNAYGKDLAAAMKALKTKQVNAAVLTRVAKLDSDKDGVTNADEVKAGTLPGDAKSKPTAKPGEKSAPPKGKSGK
ncbi:MAG: hypothetical protein GX446_18715 [Chthonomonadales bacterium]|nr:hypothetical protein [Chthonomonadales bacterium]